MKLEVLSGLKTVLFDIVPLAIEEAGIAYLNDTHLWVINLNQNHPVFDRDHVKLAQIIELLEHHAHCIRNHCDVFAQARAELLGNEAAAELAVRVGAEIAYDETAQTPHIRYTGADGAEHDVWFVDARSCAAKCELLEQYGLRGLGVWNFMRPFTAAFSLLHARFELCTSVD